MKKLFKVNFAALIIWTVEVLAFVAWILIDVKMKNDAPIDMGVFGLIFIVLFVLSAIVFLITFFILFVWTFRIYYQEQRLLYLFREFLLLIAGVVLAGLLFNLFLFNSVHIGQFVSYAIGFSLLILWEKVRECVKKYGDEMVIRRK